MFIIFSIRGRFGSYFALTMNFGILLSFIIGSYLPYEDVPYVLMVFPILYFFGVFYLPDTPMFLLKKGKIEVYILILYF